MELAAVYRYQLDPNPSVTHLEARRSRTKRLDPDKKPESRKKIQAKAVWKSVDVGNRKVE